MFPRQLYNLHWDKRDGSNYLVRDDISQLKTSRLILQKRSNRLCSFKKIGKMTSRSAIRFSSGIGTSYATAPNLPICLSCQPDIQGAGITPASSLSERSPYPPSVMVYCRKDHK